LEDEDIAPKSPALISRFLRLRKSRSHSASSPMRSLSSLFNWHFPNINLPEHVVSSAPHMRKTGRRPVFLHVNQDQDSPLGLRASIRRRCESTRSPAAGI